jgi:hypothetical protein
MAYQQTHPPYGGRYVWCDYDENWSNVTPVWFTDYLYQNFTDPSVEFINNLAYGIAYCGIDASWNYYAYFDRSNWVGVHENNSDNLDPQIMFLTPNPSRSSVNLSYTVQKSGHVRISVIDITGRLVKLVINEMQQPGEYTLPIDNQHLAAGVYVLCIETPDGQYTRTMTVVK